MRKPVLALALGLMLVGCNTGGGGVGARERVTRESFLSALGAAEVSGSTQWTAQKYLVQDPPMDGGVIDAMAAPFEEGADWAGPDGAQQRADMLTKLTKWWESTQTDDVVSDLPVDQVASRFSVVVSARILMARLQFLEGNHEMALASSVETMELARDGFLTAPGMASSDLMPSVVMAAEALAQIGEEGGGPMKTFDGGLAAMRLSIFERVAGSAREDFMVHQLATVIDQMNQSDPAATVVNVVDPMGEGDEAISTIEKAMKGKKYVDQKASAQFAKELLVRFNEPPKDFESFRALRTQSELDIKGSWGVNVFEMRPAEWGDQLSGAENAAGTTYLAAVERKWLTTIESSFVMQMNLDAARFRLSNTMNARDMVNDEWEKLVDPLTGGSYEIDNQSGVLKTSLKNVNPKFIFVNQVVLSGVPLSR